MTKIVSFNTTIISFVYHMMMFVIKHVITHYSIRFYDREKWSSRSVICFKKYSSYSIEYPTSLLEYISCTGDIDQRES
jgi:hypothetical protein